MIRHVRTIIQQTERLSQATNATVRRTYVLIPGIAFIILAVAAHQTTPLPGDLRLCRWIQGFDSTFARDIARFGNWFGRTQTAAPAAILIAALFALLRWRRDAGFVLVAYAAELSNPVLKALIAAPRPRADLVRVSEHASGWGFPSGHVMGSSLLLGAAAVTIHRRAPRWRFAAWAVAALIVLIVAFGRVHAGAHWPSQTLGGLLGAAFVLGVVNIAYFWSDRAT